MFHRSVGLLVGARTSRSFLAGVLALTVALSVQASAQAQTLRTGLAEPRPLVFVPNYGQAPANVLWQAQGQGFEASFRRDGFALRIAGVKGEQDLSLVGIDQKSVLGPLDPQPGKVNFFLGNDPAHWLRSLPTFARLRYRNVYPGIDLLFYGNHGKLEYDFVVSPGADPDAIRLRLDDGSSRITDRGELQVGEGPSAVLHRPMLYQNFENGKRLIEGKFVRSARNTVGFRFSHYDTSRTLIIDPALSLLYSTYLGGYHDDEATGIALDSQKDAYIVGYSQSPNYPVTGNAYQPERANPTQFIYNAVLTKVDSSGVLLFSTFLGGSTGETSGGIVLDSQGNAYITGFTKSSDFPVTANAYQATFPSGAPSSAFLSELSPDGSALVYSSFFGGAGGAGPASAAPGFAIALNPQGNVVIAGNAGPGLPTTAHAYLPQISTGTAAFVAVFNLALSGTAQLVASSYYGASTPAANYSGSGNVSLAMALDSSGNPWIAGQSYTNNLPTTSNAYQGSIPALNPSCGGGPLNSVGYFAKLSADLTTLDYASYLTGKTAGSTCSEYAHAIVLDGPGNVYVAGTTSSAAFPTTSGVFQATAPSAGYSEFVTKASPDGTHLLWSTYLGGSGYSFQDTLALDSQNNVWVSGTTQGGATFPLQNAYQATEGGGYDGHITEIKSDGTAVLYSTYLGGSGDDVAAAIALDPQGNVYVAGYTTSTNFPVTSNAVQPLKAGGGPDYNGNDIFFSILGVSTIGLIGPASGGNTGDTTITIGGAGLQAGDGCSLVQGATTIQAAAVTVASNGTSMSCTFALNGAATGSYNVVVSGPGGVSFTQTNAFTVTGGGSPQIWTNVVGRSEIRDGAPSNFVVTVGNSGTSDAYFTVLWISFPSTLTYSLNQPLIDPSDPLQTDYSLANATQDSSGDTVMKYILPHLPPNSTVSIGVALTAAVDTPSIVIQSYTYRPWYDSYSAASAELTAAQNGGILSPTCVPNPVKAYLNDCLGPEVIELSQDVLSRVETDPSFPGNPGQVLVTLEEDYAGRLLGVLNEDVAGLAPASASNFSRLARPRLNAGIGALIVGAIGALAAAVQAWQSYEANHGGANNKARCQINYKTLKPCCNGSAVVELYILCPGQPQVDAGSFMVPCDKHRKPQPPTACNAPGRSTPAFKGLLRFDATFSALGRSSAPREAGSCSLDDSDGEGGASGDGASCSAAGGSGDPNDKNGPAGDGSVAHYVKLSPLTYNVAFENEATATLPAAQVVVTDQLDLTKVDLTTVSLGWISFGTNIITLPSGTDNYNTTYAISSSLSVRIQGSLNADTGLLKWTFTSIDPSTGLPPSDPTVGFLPPDVNGVEGQGSVQFTVMPKANLTTGTQITNQASVVFDANAAILTPTWLNTLDVTPPVSAVAALPPAETVTNFPMSWAGSDVGSGIAYYNIYVSDNSAPFTTWLSQTAATAATYPGVVGHTYGFYSIATDGAGNVQAAKSIADATTAVSAQASSSCNLGQSGATNVADVQRMINEALGVMPANNDLNGDGVVNVVDLQIDINSAIGLGCISN